MKKVCPHFKRFPTGIGALIVKKSRLLEMVGKKRYFGGGTVEMNLIHSTHVVFKEEPEEVFEDGTINFQVMNIQPANYFYFVSKLL